jgi:predicted nucleic acid-binding protein
LSALLLDVNVHYASAGKWFEGIMAGTAPFAVPLVVWASFLRLVTNRRIFDPPTPLADAAVVASLDRDFARFPSIDVIVPGADRR